MIYALGSCLDLSGFKTPCPSGQGLFLILSNSIRLKDHAHYGECILTCQAICQFKKLQFFIKSSLQKSDLPI